MRFVIEGKELDDVVYTVGLEQEGKNVCVTLRNHSALWYLCRVSPEGLELYDGIDDPNLKTTRGGYIKVVKSDL